MQETQVSSLGHEDGLEKGVATHSSILAWRIPWTEEPGGGYSPQGGKEPDTTERLKNTTNNSVIPNIGWAEKCHPAICLILGTCEEHH